MILDAERKIAIFLTPKTGSTSLHTLLSQANPTVCKHKHTTIKEFQQQYNTLDIQGYSFYGFYRDPVDRFISALNQIKARSIKQYFLRLGVAESAITQESISEELLEKLGQFTIERHVGQSGYGGNVLFQPQINWLDLPEINLLNFASYEQEATKLATLFGIDPIVIPTENQTTLVETIPSVEQRDLIVAAYSADYEFLASKGIL